jgi:hypothetical protein
MKYFKQVLFIAACAVVASAAHCAVAQTNNAAAKIGVYDSRALAYAHFCSPEYQQQLSNEVRTARLAKRNGDQAQFEKLSHALAEKQRVIHREGFSTAPATEALAFLQSRLPDIQKQAGVSALVSKWDTNTLKQYSSATQMDVTDLLVQQFQLTDKQLKTVTALQKHPPVSLEEIDKMKD